MNFLFSNIKKTGLSISGEVNFDGMSEIFKPLPPEEPEFAFEGKEYLGVPTLTSLAFEYNNIRVNIWECIITVTQEKNIVTTPLQGRDGTVKEYISDGDYSISVDAAVSTYQINTKADENDENDSQKYPLSQLEDLIAMLKVKDTLAVHSDFLTLFGIKNAVIKQYSMVQETHSNRQAFTIQMISDTPYEIKISQDASINK